MISLNLRLRDPKAAGRLASENLSSYREPCSEGQASMPQQPPIAALPGHRLNCSGLQGPYTARHPDAHGLTHSSWFPPPSLQESKEGSQEPGSQEVLNQQCRARSGGLGRKGGGQAVGFGVRGPGSYLLLLPGVSMGLDLSRGQAPWPRRLHRVTNPSSLALP